MKTPEKQYSHAVKSKPSQANKPTVNQTKNAEPMETTEKEQTERKRPNPTENNSIKKMKYYGPPLVQGKMPPVSNQSRETARQSVSNEYHNSGDNCLHTSAHKNAETSTKNQNYGPLIVLTEGQNSHGRANEDREQPTNCPSQIIKSTRTTSTSSKPRSRSSSRNRVQRESSPKHY